MTHNRPYISPSAFTSRYPLTPLHDDLLPRDQKIELPAAYPVEKAICKLNPPVYASTSSVSPQKYSPLIFLLSIVFGSISLTFTPPAVTIPSSIGRRETGKSGNALSVPTSAARDSLVSEFTGISASQPLASITGKISFCGKRLAG